MPRILIAPDKFKGTLTAAEAAAAIARGWRQVRPRDPLELLPISDGGDGFGEVLSGLLGARKRTIPTVDAAHRPCRAQWWWDAKSKTAIIESARIIGLAMLPPGKFHPFDLDTAGLGAVLRAASIGGARRCLVGIGGSATNDGGFGLARALGWRFFDDAGDPIRRWTRLNTLAKIQAPIGPKLFDELIVAVDVRNPLLGARGAARIYGPQKGLRRNDLALAETCLRRLSRVFAREFGVPASAGSRRPKVGLQSIPGAGAAGGLGFGLMAFAGARLEPGFELFARLARLSQRMRSADVVITGEGRIDASTLMGKGVGQIAERCGRWSIPCLGLAGSIADRARVRRVFTQVYGLTDATKRDKAERKAAFLLERLAGSVARELKLPRE